MKSSRIVYVIVGLVPGVMAGLVVGWQLAGAPGERGETGKAHRSASRAEAGSDVRERRGLRYGQSGLRAGKLGLADHMPVFDGILHGRLVMDEISVLMRYRLYQEVNRLQSVDFPTVMETAKQRGQWNGELLSLLLVRWAHIDPAAAMAFGQEHLEDEKISFLGFDESNWRVLIATVDLDMNGAQAVTSLDSILPMDDSNDWWDNHSEDMDMYTLYSLKASRDPEAVFAELMSRDHSAMFSETPWMGLIDGCYKGGQMDWLMARIASCDEEDRSELRVGLAAYWATQDVAAATKWAEKLLEDGQEDVTDEIANQWAKKDPKAAGDWVLGLPSSERWTVSSKQEAAMIFYLQDNAEKAMQWLKESDRGDASWDAAKDLAVNHYIVAQHYSKAFEHMSTLSSPVRKQEALIRMFSHLGLGLTGNDEQMAEVAQLAQDYGYGDEWRRYNELVEQAGELSDSEARIRRSISDGAWFESE